MIILFKIIICVLFADLTNSVKPIIGIVSNPMPENSDYTHKSYTLSTNIQWIESLNGKTLPILYDYTNEQLDFIIPKINGLLFQGGDRTFHKGTFEKQANLIINKANKANIPIWFTCQGFELLYYILTDYTNILEHSNSWGVSLPLIPYNNIILSTTKMFKFFSETEIKTIQDESMQSTINYHNNMVSPDVHLKYPFLNDQLLITTISHDINGKEFISSVESKDFNKNKYFAVQFHPEEQGFTKDIESLNMNSSTGILIRNKIGLSFIEECYKTISTNYLSQSDQYSWGIFMTNEFNLLPNNTQYTYNSKSSNRRPSQKKNLRGKHFY